MQFAGKIRISAGLQACRLGLSDDRLQALWGLKPVYFLFFTDMAKAISWHEPLASQTAPSPKFSSPLILVPSPHPFSC
jgi:hypothetical protein